METQSRFTDTSMPPEGFDLNGPEVEADIKEQGHALEIVISLVH